MSGSCECQLWAWAKFPTQNKNYMHHVHHHENCPKYKTDEFPRLMYYEDAEDCWAPFDNELPEIWADSYPSDEQFDIQFKVVPMTDEQFWNMPEAQ